MMCQCFYRFWNCQLFTTVNGRLSERTAEVFNRFILCCHCMWPLMVGTKQQQFVFSTIPAVIIGRKRNILDKSSKQNNETPFILAVLKEYCRLMFSINGFSRTLVYPAFRNSHYASVNLGYQREAFQHDWNLRKHLRCSKLSLDLYRICCLDN